MCFDEPTSWATLALGTAANAACGAILARRGQWVALAVVLAWQYGLLMQLPDALAWRAIDRGEKPLMAGRLAFALNVSQPLAWFLLLSAVTPRTWAVPWVAAPVALYGAYWASFALRTDDFDVQPKEDCPHLNLRWWSTRDAVAYCVLMVAVSLALLPPGLAGFTVALFLGSLALSRRLYPCDTGGSVWCWSIAGSGALTAAFALGT